MPLATGTRLGPYEILNAIGEGGMGEVYRAHDSRLRRDVAIKVLPASVAGDEDRLRRFEQEALAAAALNHPNILAVYDISRADPAFVVMELLEGETMRELLNGGTPNVRRVVDYAGQVAHGLAAAHEKGIVHRDVKPENLFVTTDGRVKILDFGLAKVADGRGGGASTVLSPASTEPGMVLGTIGYMAPEQVRAQPIDHRADVFSFGAVLYELLTGKRAFAGDTSADTMTAILKESPPSADDSGRAIPPALARVVDRCLEKNPARRFQSASDLAFALQTLGTESRSGSAIVAAPAEVAGVSARRKGLFLAAGVAVIAVAALAMFAGRTWLAPAAEPRRFMTFDVAAPPGLELGLHTAISPDGTTLAFVVVNPTKRTSLWLRNLASGEARPLAGTDDAHNPFWSPNSRAIAYFATGRLRVIDADTSRVRVVCDVVGMRTAGAWNDQGVILFSSEAGTPIAKVDARGQTPPVPLPQARGFRPSFLPDGRHFLFSGSVYAPFIRVGDIESNAVVELPAAGRDARYVAGHLLYVLGNELLAQPFDATTLELSGEPMQLVAAIGSYAGDVGPNYSVLGDRFVAIRRQPLSSRQLTWFRRDGTRLGIVEGDGDWSNPALSPDDSLVAAERNERQGTSVDVWIHDVARQTSRSLTSARDSEMFPTWSGDGSRVIFKSQTSSREGDAARNVVLEKRLDSVEQTTLPFQLMGTLDRLSPDGRVAVEFRVTESANRDIVIVPVDGSPSRAFIQGPSNETQPALSPDGRWLAYVSDEFNRGTLRDIFIQAFPGGGQKRHVTVDGAGGVQPRWRRDGRELFYLRGDGRLVAVPMQATADALRLGTPQVLFHIAVLIEAGIGTRAAYDVTRDGQRFIVAEPRSGQTDAPITVLVNWLAGLKKRAAADDGMERK